MREHREGRERGEGEREKGRERGEWLCTVCIHMCVLKCMCVYHVYASI